VAAQAPHFLLAFTMLWTYPVKKMEYLTGNEVSSKLREDKELKNII